MTPILKRLTSAQKVVLIALVAVLCVYVTGSFISNWKLRLVTDTLTMQATEQRGLLTSLAEAASQNRVDETLELILRDCSATERTRFDTLLGRLDQGLSSEELLELDRLFGRCGDFFAQRKAVMAYRLEREVSVYESYLAQLSEIKGESILKDYRLESWQKLAEQEKKQGEYFMQLVALQGEIITALISGKSADSEDIKSILGTVSEVQGILIVTNKQAATTRAEITTQ